MPNKRQRNKRYKCRGRGCATHLQDFSIREVLPRSVRSDLPPTNDIGNVYCPGHVFTIREGWSSSAFTEKMYSCLKTERKGKHHLTYFNFGTERANDRRKLLLYMNHLPLSCQISSRNITQKKSNITRFTVGHKKTPKMSTYCTRFFNFRFKMSVTVCN